MRQKKSKLFLYLLLILLVIFAYFISKDLNIKQETVSEEIKIQNIIQK